MGSNITNEDMEHLFKKKKKKYRTWNKSDCPPLGQVHINTHFWRHIKENKNKRTRSYIEVIRRLSAIGQTKKLLESVSHVQDVYEESKGSTKTRYWFILGHTEHGRLGIVLRAVQQGNIHLYSIIPDWNGYIPRQRLIDNAIKIETL